MGGSYSGSGGQSGSSPAEIWKAYNKFLPQFTQQTAEGIGGLTGTIGQAGLGAVTGVGGQLAGALSGLNANLNPSVGVANQANAASLDANRLALTQAGLGNTAANDAVNAARAGVNAIDLTGLSPGEMAATERALANTQSASGNLGLLNPSNVISNAMNFGGAFNSKLPIYNQAVNTLTGTAGNASNAAGSTVNVGNAFGNTSNAANNTTATNMAGMTGLNAIANPSQFATTAQLGVQNQLQQMATGNKSSNQSSSVGGNMSCCFIFLESYHGFLPVNVRRFRDKYYNLQPDIAIGYKRMAKWLVPLMKKSKLIRELVWRTMVKPATEYCNKTVPGLNKTISHAWLRFWAIYGKI